MPSHTESIPALELEKAKRSIDQFLYSCSHSLRAPLKSAQGILQLLKMSYVQGITQETEQLVNALEDSIRRMESTVIEMHEFLLNSSQQIEMKPVMLSTVMNEIVQSMAGHPNYRRVQTDIIVSNEAPMRTDVERIKVLFRHLLLNAYTFADSNKQLSVIQVHIHVNEQEATVSIVDNGIGMSKEVLPRIFDLFYRGTVQSRGAGVGLHLVREIVQAVGGSIHVSSIENEGSTFSLTLPNMTDVTGPLPTDDNHAGV